MAIEKKITKIKFKGSKSLRDKRTRIKNIGNVKENANFLFKKILNKKKKKALTIIFIIVIIKIFDGGIKKTKEIIKPKIKDKNISFFPYFSLASIISFNYNRKLWQKRNQSKLSSRLNQLNRSSQ